MFNLQFLSLVIALSLLIQNKAFAFTDGGPGLLPPEPPLSESKEDLSVTAAGAELATQKRALDYWQACYENSKATQPPVMQRAALVKIADVQYQMGNLAEAERLYKEASDKTEADLLSLADKAFSNHEVSICALNSYACFLAEKGQIVKASMLMRLIYKLLKEPNICSFNVGFGGNDDFGTFVAIVKEKDAKAYSEFYPQWKEYKAKIVPRVVSKVSGLRIDLPDVEQMSDFVDDKAVARDKLTCRYGYINQAGKWVIKPTFIAANPFSKGVATAKTSSGILPIDVEGSYHTFSLIDCNGKELMKLPSMHVSPFVGPFCFDENPSRTPSMYIFDHSGDTLYSGLFRVRSQTANRLTIFKVTGNTRRGCIVDEEGDTVTLELKPDASRPGHFILIPVAVGSEG